MIIDAHVALGTDQHLTLEVDELLRRMDANGIESAIARPTGAELVVHNRAGNGRVLSAGPRVRGLATANPWYGAEAIDELKRCRDLGAVGLYLHPTRQGFMPTDVVVAPLIEFAASVNWPVVFHTGTYINSDVLAVGELARRFPSGTFVCDSAGFTDMWFELPGLLAEHENIVLCASLIWGKAIGNTVRERGAGQVMFGSGEPRDRMEAARRRIDRLELSQSEQRAVFFENAKRVFRI